MPIRRSQLYTPGNNERMIRKAASEINADSIIIDLEDAVPINNKDEARRLIRDLLPQLDWGNKEVCVRVNGPDTPFFYDDISVISKIDIIKCLVIPKAETDLSFVYKATGREIEPIIETAKGLLKIEDVVRSDGITALTYGVADYALSVNGDVKAYEQNPVLKSLVVAVAKSYNVDPIDKVFFDIKDIEGFRRDCAEAKALGYVGKQVIHPSQVEIANEVFTPTKEEIEWARKVVEAYEEAAKMGRGAIRLNDQLIDNVHYKLAKRILDFVNRNLK